MQDQVSAEDAILALCSERGTDKTICPTEVAKECARLRGQEDGLAWQSYLTEVRATAVTLAKQGRIAIYRKGKPVDPDDFRGVYRLGLPRHD